MKFRGVLFVCLFLTFLIIGSLNASDLTDECVPISENQDIVLMESVSEVTVIDEGVSESAPVSMYESDSIDNAHLEEAVSGSVSDDLIGEDSPSDLKNFTDLDNLINNNSDSDIYLENNYTFSYSDDYSFMDGIIIDRTVTIHGNGHTINGFDNARIFEIILGNVILRDIVFDNAYGYENGGAILGNCSIVNCTFINNSAYKNGGAIYGNCSIENCTFTLNCALWNYGGAIYGNCNIKNCSFINNSAKYYSGAIYGDGTIEHCNFINNSAGYYGGAVYGKGTISDSNFTLNKAGYGGAVYYGSLVNCTFINNTASSMGGALSHCNADNCSFINNTASTNGGACHLSNLTNCRFIGNIAMASGGALYRGDEIENCTFINNSAYKNGGAICNATASNCNFTQNNATGYGGAICNGTAIYCNFTLNDALKNGGAMCNGTASNCTFLLNFATGSGVDLYDVQDEYCTFLTPTFSVHDFESDYNAGEKLFFNLTYDDFNFDGYSASIKVKNDKFERIYHALSGDEGGWTVNLAPGIYNATLTLDYSNVPQKEFFINIHYIPDTLTVTDLNTTYNSDDYIVASLKDNESNPIAFVPLTVEINGNSAQYTTDENGQIKASIVGVPVNTYTVKVSFAGTDYFAETSANGTLNIKPQGTALTLSLSADNVVYDSETITATFTLTDDGGKPVDGEIEVFINGKEEIIQVSNGKATKTFDKIDAGNYTIIANFTGDENYFASNEVIKYFNVTRLGSQIIYQDMTTTAVDTATDGRVGKYFTITLKDKNGKILANKAVQIGFNGKVYNRTTDENGQAKLQINLERADIYTFAVSFLGDENYIGSFVVAKITVNNQKGSLTLPNKSYKASAKTKTVSATFKSASGKVVANKKVSFTVNGKTYSATTNSKGVASVNVSLNKKGSYKITAKFAGDNIYAAITKTATLKLT